ncbi:MAG: phosphatidylserine decarboxylase [Sulfurospirillaceae bacterium]|nr:phosphatidylserine decarboxylase [Sulfurospirillaceae bacterium]
MKRKPTFKTSCISRIFGTFAQKEFPTPIQKIINQTYTKLMHVDLKECDDATSYASLNALFTRKLNVARVLEGNENTFISPCDGFISEAGVAENDQVLQIKGFLYNYKELLGDYIAKENRDKLSNGTYINFYLSPKDYHRYHSPIDMRISKAVHIPGKLYPVNFKWLQKIPSLFIENERVVLECYTKDDKLFYMVFVGALNVGKMRFTFDESIQTNAKTSSQQFYMYKNVELEKGDELGRFEMGSTIVMFFETNSVDLKVKRDTSICFGQSVAQKI